MPDVIADSRPVLSPENIATSIVCPAESLILLLGSVDPVTRPQLRSLFERALIPVALFVKAAIVDDAAAAGLGGLLAEAIDEVEQQPATLGLLEPGELPAAYHSSSISLHPEWTDLTRAKFQIVAKLSEINPAAKKPVIILLAGGGSAERSIALRCARRGWPVMLLAGSGGLADEILASLELAQASGVPPPTAHPDIRELIDLGSLRKVPMADNTDVVTRALLAPFGNSTEVLADAWGRYDDLDRAAVEKQSLFRRNQFVILSLTVLATLLAVVVSVVKLGDSVKHPELHPLASGLHVTMIIVPIIISVLVGINARFRDGNKWLLLRGAAESIKQQIYRFRTRSGIYSEDQCIDASAETRLAASIRTIAANLAQSEVNRINVSHSSGVSQNRSSSLSAEDYIRERLEDQISYLVKKTSRLYVQLKRLQFWILLAGGFGTFLAAVHQEVWVALTTACATALAHRLELDQVENSLVQYNAALTALRNVHTWWKGLSPWERSRQKNVDLLVDQTESILDQETTGWVQRMQSALERLTETESASEKEKKK